MLSFSKPSPNVRGLVRNFSQCSKGWIPLHLAAEEGHLSVCRLIVENVDDRNPKNEDGFTPLALATTNHNLEIKNLIENAISAGSNQGSNAKME